MNSTTYLTKVDNVAPGSVRPYILSCRLLRRIEKADVNLLYKYRTNDKSKKHMKDYFQNKILYLTGKHLAELDKIKDDEKMVKELRKIKKYKLDE